MNDDSYSDDNDISQEEMLERAKKLLMLTDLVDRYPAVVERRVTGLVFVLIGGGVSLATLIFMSLFEAIEALGFMLLGVVIFVVLSLSVSFIIAFRLVVPLTQSYATTSPSEQEGMTLMKIMWGIFAIVMVVVSIYSFGTGQVFIFPIVVQLLLGIGNLVIYDGMRKDPKTADYSRSHLVLVILVFVSLIPIVLVPPLAFSMMILIDIGGLYALGIYILITAERLLVHTVGSG
ncbi:MAG: hypothetical protein ACFFED_02510 [Candidatus Thorarchaeota archaeon]